MCVCVGVWKKLKKLEPRFSSVMISEDWICKTLSSVTAGLTYPWPLWSCSLGDVYWLTSCTEVQRASSMWQLANHDTQVFVFIVVVLHAVLIVTHKNSVKFRIRSMGHCETKSLTSSLMSSTCRTKHTLRWLVSVHNPVCPPYCHSQCFC